VRLAPDSSAQGLIADDKREERLSACRGCAIPTSCAALLEVNNQKQAPDKSS
jgi:hypothetical protein